MAISIPYPSFQDGQTIVAGQHNSNNSAIASFVDALQAGTNFNAGVIGTATLADDSVTSAKIAANAVGLSELASAVADALVPTGSIVAYAGGSAPSGWLLCDGSGFSSATYPALYAVLNNTATTPDLRERVPMGASGAIAVRTTGGTRKIQLNDLPAHSHPNTMGPVSVTGTVSVSLSDPGHNHSAITGTTGSSHAHPLPTVRQGPASSAHNGSTTMAAGFSGTDVYLNTSATNSEHTHSVQVYSNTTGVGVDTASWSQTSGSVTITNENNSTTYQDYYQPYYSVNYIIKAA